MPLDVSNISTLVEQVARHNYASNDSTLSLMNCHCVKLSDNMMADFGVARSDKGGEPKTSYEICHQWCAPERILGAVDYDISADMYSVGIICIDVYRAWISKAATTKIACFTMDPSKVKGLDISGNNFFNFVKWVMANFTGKPNDADLDELIQLTNIERNKEKLEELKSANIRPYSGVDEMFQKYGEHMSQEEHDLIALFGEMIRPAPSTRPSVKDAVARSIAIWQALDERAKQAKEGQQTTSSAAQSTSSAQSTQMSTTSSSIGSTQTSESSVGSSHTLMTSVTQRATMREVMQSMGSMGSGELGLRIKDISDK
eukprot:720561_1